jgi:hypothetical protein
MKRRIINTGFLLFLTMAMMAQEAQDEARVNSFALNWGMGNIKRQDFTISPFTHRDYSPLNFQLVYERSKKLEQQASLKFGQYSPRIGEEYTYYSFYNGEETAEPHYFTMIDINYALGLSVLEKRKWKLIIGGKSKNQFYASTYNFGPSGPSPLYIAFGLNIWLNLKYDLNEKHHFKSNLSLPLFAHIYRDPYLAQDDEFFQNLISHKPLKELAERIKDGEMQSWGTSQSFDFDLSYAYVINEKWNLGFTYRLSMDFNQSPTRFSQVENVIYINGTFKF